MAILLNLVKSSQQGKMTVKMKTGGRWRSIRLVLWWLYMPILSGKLCRISCTRGPAYPYQGRTCHGGGLLLSSPSTFPFMGRCTSRSQAALQGHALSLMDRIEGVMIAFKTNKIHPRINWIGALSGFFIYTYITSFRDHPSRAM